MDRILDLLARLADLTDAERDELTALLADLSAYDDDTLTAVLAAVADATEALAEQPPTAENVAAINTLGDIREQVTTAQTERATEAERLAAEREAALARARGEQPAEEQTPEGDETPVEGDEDTDTEAPAEETAHPAETSQAVAASATPPAPSSRAAGMAARTRPAAPQRPAGLALVPSLTASADIRGVPAGSPVRQPRTNLPDLLARRATDLRNAKQTNETAVVASARWEYPAERTLGDSPSENERLIAAATALVAAGGPCAPATVRYDQINLGTVERPVWDTALNRFGAPRLAVTWVPSQVMGDLAGGVTQWTMDEDRIAANPGDPAYGATVKPCVRIDCGTPDTVELYAVPWCATIGNAQGRAAPERVANGLDLLRTYHARFGESLLLASIHADSVALTSARLLGATRDLLGQLDAMIAGIRYRERMSDNQRVRLIFPRWARDLMRADLARQLASDMRALAVTNAMVDEWFDARGCNVTWALDARNGVADQDFDTEAAGPLDPFPGVVEWYAYPEGTHLGLDGGSLDFGIVRDSALNSRNDYTVAAETWEGTLKAGNQSYVIRSTVCPDGLSAATVATAGLCV